MNNARFNISENTYGIAYLKYELTGESIQTSINTIDGDRNIISLYFFL